MANPVSKLTIVATAALLTLSLTSCGKGDKPEKSVVRPVKTMIVSAPKKFIIRNFPGKVLATDQAKLAFEVSGRLIKLPILEGHKVKQGQMLAEIDPKSYQEKVNEAKARLVRREAEYKRAGTLVKDGYVSRTEYDQKRSSYLVAKANYNTALKDLNDTKVIAPFNGVIARRYVKNFENVKAKEVIILLQNIKQLDIEINVPENIILNLKSNPDDPIKPLAIFESAPGKEYSLKLKEFSAEADPETQTYRVLYTFPAPTDINVLPGMSVSVKIPIPDPLAGSKDHYIIPSEAVIDSPDGKPSVWLVDKKTMTVKRHVVQISRLENNEIRILSGLKQGDEIVVAGAVYLRENQKVSIMKPLKGTNGQ